ncbi:MAG: hypothetical protein K0S38_210 [Candidatus Paceibacter sp.]|jgi:hypothetical protein|nr:hypothetical protein [Candidatus Paceibacter sp.]
MKAVFGDKKTIRDGFIHFLLADVIFAAFLGGSIEFFILFALRGDALFMFQGIGGIIIEALVIWGSVFLSARCMQRKRTDDILGIAGVSTGLALLAALLVIPYSTFISDLARVSGLYLFIKQSLHVCIFYTATIFYFSGLSARGLLKDQSSPKQSVLQ